MRRRRSIVRGFGMRVSLALALLAPVALAAPGPAGAYYFSPSSLAGLYDFKCTSSLSWAGELPPQYWLPAWDMYKYQTKGTVSWCLYVIKIQDSNSSSDFYIGLTTTDWATTYNPGGTKDNRAELKIWSSAAAQAYTGNPSTLVWEESCANVGFTISVPTGIGPTLGGSVTQRMCKNGRLQRDTLNSTQAKWSSPNIVLTPRWELEYIIKVAQGVKPTFYATLTRPQYAVWRYAATNTSYPLEWRYSQSFMTNTMSISVR